MKGWPDFDHLLDSELFLSSVLNDQHLDNCLSKSRLDTLLSEIADDNYNENDMLNYLAPVTDINVLPEHSADLVFSQSVMEYVEDLQSSYDAQFKWLQPGGIISHQIDLSSHSISHKWDGFRGIGEFQWKLICGKRPYHLNRLPCSEHVRAIQNSGFEITTLMQRYAEPSTRATGQWQNLSLDDKQTSGLFVQARKP